MSNETYLNQAIAKGKGGSELESFSTTKSSGWLKNN